MAAEVEPLVHHKETSVEIPTEPTYQAYQRAFCPDEWHAAEQLYTDLPYTTKVPYSEQLASCRTSAWFLRHLQTGELRIASNSCRLRWCPLCSQARQNYITWQVGDWMKSARKPKFVSFTLKHNTAPLKQQVTALYRFFRKVRSNRLMVKNAKGGLWFFHIKRSKDDGLWHPHIHAVCEGNFIPQKELSRLWKRITGTSTIVDIRPCRNAKKTANEIARYSARPANLREHSQSDRKELWWAMHGRKLCGSWGTARDVSLKPPKAEDRHMWEKIGDFTKVITTERTNAFAKDIMKAWRSSTPLPPGIHVLSDYDRDQYDWQHRQGKYAIEPKRCQEQPYLF